MDPFLLFLFVENFDLDNKDGPLAMSPNRQALFRLLDDEALLGACKGILLRIDTTGGCTAGKEELYRDLESCSMAGIPIVVSISTQAISAGLYVSLVGDRVFALGNSAVGGVGVAMIRAKETNYTIQCSTSPLKEAYLGDRTPTEAELEIMGRYIGDLHEDFVKRIVERRPKVRDRIDEISTGNLFTGRQALALGLVDELGGLREAVAHLRQITGTEFLIDIYDFGRLSQPSEDDGDGPDAKDDPDARTK